MTQQQTFYFDNNATTRVAPEVIDAMTPFFRDLWGNPSSVYGFGRQVNRHIEKAREKVAALINAEPREIVFTSCGTESNNSAIHSALVTHPSRRHILTTAVEHSANIKFCAALKKQGYDITLFPVEPDGSLDIHLFEKAIRSDTAVVSVMWANNETGVLFPIEELAAICRSKGVTFHTDAVQVPGKLKIDVQDLGVDMLSLSAHKLNAPKGVGLLYLRHKLKYAPFVTGGGQEQGRRGGTENVPYIAGFGRAAELAMAHLKDENTRVRAMRDRLESEMLKHVSGTVRNGSKQNRLPNTANLSFSGIEAEQLLLALDQLGICVSSGSACTSGSLDPSHVLMAMGCTAARARASIRFSFGIYNNDAELDYLIKHLPGVIARLRGQTGKARDLAKVA
ncbi:MAG TPA: cysteine desulfurase NifS [Verrucomicrobiae bacterium]|nr:cysteine desulfurase NifS [Verrucomicrobiae bacterium]